MRDHLAAFIFILEIPKVLEKQNSVRAGLALNLVNNYISTSVFSPSLLPSTMYVWACVFVGMNLLGMEEQAINFFFQFPSNFIQNFVFVS